MQHKDQHYKSISQMRFCPAPRRWGGDQVVSGKVWGEKLTVEGKHDGSRQSLRRLEQPARRYALPRLIRHCYGLKVKIDSITSLHSDLVSCLSCTFCNAAQP